MDYSLSMYLRYMWYDARLSFDAATNNNFTTIKLPDNAWDQIWIPEVVFRNEKHATFHDVSTANRMLRLHDTGKVWYVFKVTAQLSCPMGLQSYPFDTQGCPLRIESFGYDSSVVVYKWFQPKDQAVQFDPGGLELPVMVIHDFVLEDCSYNSTFMYPPGAFPCLEVVFIVKRDFAYFLMQYYITSALFVVLSWVSFWISVDAVVARVIIGLVTVLTLTMQSTASRDQLPRVSYVKAIDIWMSTCLVFAFASLIEFAVVNVWSRRDARRSRASAAIAALRRRSSVAAVAAVFGRRGPMPMPPPMDSRRSPSPADQQPQPQPQQQLVDGLKPSSTCGASQLQPPDNALPVTSSPSPSHLLPAVAEPVRKLSFRLQRRFMTVQQRRADNIDRLARKLFPLSFVAFNVVYWLSYML